MWGFFLDQLLRPLTRRLGTAASSFLIGAGVATDEANMIAAGLMAAVGVGVDLLQSWSNRRKAG